ncbi:Aldehyde/histidinol dehydrogenase [Aspergillus ambiguus]|uniref:NAD-dependent succinate-semialdehyde dehydrogenase n=1 Tax=Aspergillus ambiguus TaxID=176160 RepID=UPI003CCD01AB
MSPSFASSLKDPGLWVESSYINGTWVQSKSGKTLEVRNPASDAVLGKCPESTLADLNDAIDAAAAAFPAWRSLPGRQRGRVLRRFYELLVQNKQDLGQIILAENGKAKADAEGEVMFSASFFEWFAEEAPRVYGEVIPHSNASSRIQAIKQPIGFIAAAFAAGCTVVLKSDGLTPLSSNALAAIGERAGVPKGVINVVTARENTPQLGLGLCDSNIVKKISFTGSTRVGKLLMKQSSSTLKKLSLELGGNAPFIVFGDADIGTAITSALVSKFKMTGQTCVCANRIYVQNGIYERFSQRLVEEVNKFRVGDGSDDSVTHGPLTNGLTKVQEHIKDAVNKNAKVLSGGNPLLSLGNNFHEITVLGEVEDSMLHAALTKFSTEEEVIQKANNCDVGLASYLMTTDLARSHRVSEKLEAGMVAINTGVISDASAPFGGVKHSGMGREGSKYGIEDYMTIKMIVTGGINTLWSSL